VNWRIHPAITAGLLLLVCVLAAIAIYSGASPAVRILVSVFALVFLVGAVGAARIALVADEEGIAVRSTFKTSWVDWDDVADIVMSQRLGGTTTLTIVRRNGRSLTIPPTLVQPSRPSNSRATTAYVGSRLAALQGARPKPR
jgi:hypothetical protein